ncbi:uncharacterized protein LOC129892170 [Solanum dulcamara]|uniref:uncharacterized protein LOC129892170 n=1 Tax=Solanum dulcamara TaxID=45834 RepID=UPI002485AE1C|nr:uncharacterized protein LOC129892170 [Solanum dulcamara]
MDQWVLFVNYRIDEKTQKLCKKSQQIRQNQISHTGGAKSLDRRRAEMMAKGIDIDRGKMWTETHKRKDGSYVTEAARDIGISILLIYDYSSSYLIRFLVMIT